MNLKTTNTPRSSFKSRLVVALTALIIVPADAFCAGSGHSEIASLLPYWVNFIIYAAALLFLLRKVIPGAWSARRNTILESVMRSARELEAAEIAVEEAEERTKNVEAECRNARQEIVKQAEIEAAQIIAAAREKAQRQKAQATDLIRGETRSAETTFRAELVSKALELAKEKFRSGAFASKESSYRDAALSRARRLMQ